MKSSSTFMQANIIQMGTLAHACIAPGQRGKVLAVCSKAIYLLTNNSELFWIVSGEIPMHRRALKISVPLSGARTGSPFQVQDDRLIIDPEIVCDIKNASVWKAPLINRSNTTEINEIPTRIETLFSNIALHQARGFGNFIPDILCLAKEEPICLQSELSDPILVFARPYIVNMARACLYNQPSQILQVADALIGLGEGLTPSGDDFLGGLLFAMKTLHVTYPDLNSIGYAIPIEIYSSRTHLISLALLKDLASGDAIAPMHQIINGLLSNESFEKIYLSVSQLTQVGHSTGWDLLTGLLTGLLITYRSNHILSYFRMIQNIKA